MLHSFHTFHDKIFCGSLYIGAIGICKLPNSNRNLVADIPVRNAAEKNSPSSKVRHLLILISFRSAFSGIIYFVSSTTA